MRPSTPQPDDAPPPIRGLIVQQHAVSAAAARLEPSACSALVTVVPKAGEAPFSARVPTARHSHKGHDMDETQIDKLGNRMRDVYGDVATTPEPAADVPKHPSRRLRKNRYVTRPAARSQRSPTTRLGNGTALSISDLMARKPVMTLLVLAGVGYLLAKLSR